MSSYSQQFINIGLSHSAAHLLTQFYNIEESILHQQRNRGNCRENHSVNLDVRVDKLRKLAYYTPRSILYDTQNSGSYSSNWTGESVDDEVLQKYEKVETLNGKISQSAFQKVLDAGKMPKTVAEIEEDEFENPEGFMYWTDYNKFLLKPENLILSEEWYHNNHKYNSNRIPVSLPLDENGAEEEEQYVKYFLQPESGKNEYRMQKNELWDEKLHHWLERCDNFRHFNLVSEFDSAWGYLNCDLLKDIRDEFPKITLFQYSLSCDSAGGGGCEGGLSPTDRSMMLMNSIINTVECVEDVSLLFPLSYSGDSARSFDTISRQSLVFQTINSVFDSGDNITPNELVRRLTFNDNSSVSEQKILSNITANGDKEFDFIANFAIPKNFQHGKFKSWKLKDDYQTHVFGAVNISRTDQNRDHDCLLTYPLDKSYLNTFPTPNSYLEISDLALSISNSRKFTNVLKYWLNYTLKNKKYIENSLSLEIEHVEEIIEKQHALLKAYSLGKSYLDVSGFSFSDEDESDFES